MKIIVTGGAGFIGSTLIKALIDNIDHHILNIDKLTYASNLESLETLASSQRYSFLKGDICNTDLLQSAISNFKPDAIFNLAAESHVDRSISSPEHFIHTNIIGTYNLLNCSLDYWKSLDDQKKTFFRFIHISTDEVFGSLSLNDKPFNESSRYKPNSPYSASKASSDHLVRAWNKTYNFPTIITNCSNNYGPFQTFDKLIPLTIKNAYQENNIPIYGDGLQIRDWLHVSDHVNALISILFKGEVGDSYCIGGNSEIQNIEVVNKICKIVGSHKGKDLTKLIKFVTDRPGHDFRYSIDASKLTKTTGWKPKYSFNEGIQRTVEWYLRSLNA